MFGDSSDSDSLKGHNPRKLGGHGKDEGVLECRRCGMAATTERKFGQMSPCPGNVDPHERRKANYDDE